MQIMTGDDWGNICRHLMKDSGEGAVGIAIFFIIYQVLFIVPARFVYFYCTIRLFKKNCWNTG